MRKVIIPSLLLILAFSGYANPSEEDIQEAVFRYQFKHCVLTGSNEVYYLSVAGKDPSDELMRRFQGHQPSVEKGSRLQGISGKASVSFFNITGIRWKNSKEVEVEETCAFWGSAEGYVCRVLQEGDRWVVKECRVVWSRG